MQIGDRVTQGENEYELVDLLASGGFGEAFLAQQTKPLQRKVVVKSPKAAIVADPIWARKFAREARVLANITHPNVVRVIAFWEFSDQHGHTTDMALVQELVPGAKALNEYLAAHPEDAVSVFLQVLYALRAFHLAASPSIVHRDLSPRNILVSDAGLVKVIDFGLSKEDPRATQVLTQTGEWFGTPGCMSPEQATDAQGVDHRTDLYAIGRSFAASLQRRHPQHADPSQLPEPWRRICSRLSEHDADRRYQSASEALADAMIAFATAGLTLKKFETHVQEHRSVEPPLPGWPQLCAAHFYHQPCITQAELQLASSLDSGVLQHPALEPPRFFDLFEGSDAVREFEAGNVLFSDGDYLGSLYADLYPALDPDRRVRCFDRVCNHAVRLHRFSMMGALRRMFAGESSPAVAQELAQTLDRIDPGRVVHGHGVIPGR